MKIIINPQVKEIMEMVESRGYDIYLIGGAIRDGLIGMDNNDYDLCTNMPLEMMNSLFPSFKIMRENNHRHTGVMHYNGLEIEISSFHGHNIIEDLSKRDFTINAIGANKDGNIIDPYNGVEDIKNKVIRLVDNSGMAIDIDPLRILRAIRFAAILDFKIDSNTKSVINSKKKLLHDVAKERIYNELIKILMSDNPSKEISENKEIFFEIIPELEVTNGFDQNNPYHVYNVFDHTMKVLANTPKDLYLRLAALFHDIGKPFVYSEDSKGIGHFIGHEDESKRIFNRFADTYRVDSKTKNIVGKLVEYHDKELSIKPVKMTKFLQRFGVDELERLFLLKEADIKGHNPDIEYYRLMDLYGTRKKYFDHLNTNPCLSIKDLKINGRKLLEMGYEGRQISFILKDILTKVTEDNIKNDEEKLEDYVHKTY